MKIIKNEDQLWQFVILISFSLLIGKIIVESCYLLQEGRNFPTETQLQYSEGTLSIKYIPPRGRQHLILTDPITNDQTEFSCSYSAYKSIEFSDCTSGLNFPNYSGQQAKIGWYYQDDFMGFHNTFPQVVTLQVGDKKILSYDYQKIMMDKVNQGREETALVGVPALVVLGAYLYYIVGKKRGD